LIGGGGSDGFSCAPHLPQKFDADGFSAPHWAQAVVSTFPQCAQKLLPGGLLVPHFEQRIGLTETSEMSPYLPPNAG
jgi:hypothetical protein